MLSKFQLTRTKQMWNGLLKKFTNYFGWQVKHCWLLYWNFVMGVLDVRFDTQLKSLVVNITCGTSFLKYAHNFELWHDVFAYFSVLQWYWVFRFFVCCCCYFTFQYHFLTMYLCTDSLKDMFWIDVLQLHIQFKEGVFLISKQH